MGKKHYPTRFDPVNPPRRLREGLFEAERLQEKKKAKESLELLEELVERYPNQPDVLGLMANACYKLQNVFGYLGVMRDMHRLTPNRAEVKLGLAGGYLANERPALALVTFREFLERWPQHERAGEVREAVRKLESGMADILAELGMKVENDLDFACQHEEIQVCMEHGEYACGKQLVEKLQRQRPDFVPPLNNLSQVYWLEGNLPKAVETCRKVLTIEPENVHALSNLARFLYMQGLEEEAGQAAQRLKESTADAAEGWRKKVEALSFIGDDAGVSSIAAEALADENQSLDPMFFCWLAASEYRLGGNESRARAYWRKALKLDPEFSLARENLDNLKKKPSERYAPWAAPLQVWVGEHLIRSLTSTIERIPRKDDDQSLHAAARRFLDLHPELLHLAAPMLARGDPQAKEFVINLADMSAHPALLAALKEYTFGQTDPDSVRMQAAQVLSKHNAAPTGSVNMWLEGGWRSILLLGFEITPEPIFDKPLKPKVLELMEQAIAALREENGALAEQHLRKALAIQPEQPSLLNNLALALSMQDKDDESEALFQHITEDFPDYFFGQMALARKAIKAGDYEKARSLVNHWMENKKQYHVTEFSVLCKIQIDLMVQEKLYEGALSWLGMWENACPDAPEFETYKKHLYLLNTIAKVEKRLSRSSLPYKMRMGRGRARKNAEKRLKSAYIRVNPRPISEMYGRESRRRKHGKE